jgi:hypothetical protein
MKGVKYDIYIYRSSPKDFFFSKVINELEFFFNFENKNGDHKTQKTLSLQFSKKNNQVKKCFP